MIVKGTHKEICYEDDLVVVYDSDGIVAYKGIEDYEPMKYEPWTWDADKGYYTLNGWVKVCVS